MSSSSGRPEVWWDSPSARIVEILPDLLSIPGVVEKNIFEYILLAKLGNGMCGSVVKCQNNRTGELVAMKCIGKAILDRSAESRQKVVREIRITSTLSTVHKGIIGLSEIFIHDSRIFIAMEIAEGGDLFEVVTTKKGGLPEPVAISLFRQMVEAVSFLHAMGISHRDIKPENFLLTANNEIKLCDFGFCANFFRDDDDDEDQVAAVEQLPFGTPCGTASYIAPEVILGQRYTQAVDVWSLGVSLYVMVSGLDPWGSPARARERKLSGDFKPLPDISEHVAGLLRRMIQPEPSKRITIQQLLADPLIAGAGRIQNGRELLVGVSPKTLARLNRRNVG